MASKGPRSKLDHETRAKRQKPLESAKEPRRPKTHWDHVLEEMVWLSKDFESERKWKLAQAKKVAIRASKGMLDQATRGERRVKEEEQRLRKVALNISKDVKKFWTKIEKLVLYKHQLEFDEKKKKALDKQLEFLLGQTERYSTMLAENLVSSPIPCKPVNSSSAQQDLRIQCEGVGEDDVNRSAELNEEKSNVPEIDDDYDIQSEDESEDDEHTIEEDEALITTEERDEELAALQNEVDLPLDELLKRYGVEEVDDENKENEEIDARQCNGKEGDIPPAIDKSSSPAALGRCCVESNGFSTNLSNHVNEVKVNKVRSRSKRPPHSDNGHMVDDYHDDQDDDDFVLGTGLEKECNMDDETTLSEEEAMEKTETNDALDEIALLQKESEIPIDELFARYKEGCNTDEDVDDNSDSLSASSSDDFLDPSECKENELKQAVGLMNEDDEPTVSQIASDDFLDSSECKENALKQAVGLMNEDDEATVTEIASDDFLDSSECKENKLKQTVGLLNEDAEPTVSQHADCSQKGNDGAEDVGKSGEERENESRIADAAAAARSAQPTGNTFLTTKVRTKFPFLLKYSLREYQHIGLDWLVTMYEKKLNGILADEMGLGKTIMTIALLAHLACEKGIWGPHLIVVPTSVMLNWETEFFKWCPAFKILTYFGSAKERKIKRQGWLKQNSFHVCITTYRLVIQDSKVFKRKKWKYLILDEAHLIKNWKSQRWQTLLNFNSKRRILLTGTPLQNDLMELWSLMHFLMPHIFQSHQEFKDWFSNPITGMVEGQEKVNKEVIDRLHNVLRPFILRRLKRDVEKQLPGKHEHIIPCRLSRRQRNLYEDFIASSETQATLASSNFFGMISVIMQLRKVCNHPDLFEGRPIVSSFDMIGIDMQINSIVCSMLMPGMFSNVDLSGLGFLFTHLDFSMTSWESDEVQAIQTPSSLIESRASSSNIEEVGLGFKQKKLHGTNIFEEIQKALREERLREAKERAASIAWWNTLRCRRRPMYSTGLQELVTIKHPVNDIHSLKSNPLSYLYSSKLAEIVLSPVERFQKMVDQVESFMFAIPAARAPPPVCWCSKTGTSVFFKPTYKERCFEVFSPRLTAFRPVIVRRQVYFPDRRLIQFDCGKLQELAVLLRRLKSEGHRALIFTQMTKMLDILEAFINLYGYTYMRLDGSTQPEERQMLMQRFNTNPKFFLFILSTRSGGVGINLVGADTVIFYDSDWNPAMDQQAQDRCHRIGQTREVHIYRLISESTIEENILKKANQKRALDDLVIQGGSYNTEFFKKLDPMELFSGHRKGQMKGMQSENHNSGPEAPLSNADVEAALKNAEDEADYMALKKVEQEEAVDNQEFTEDAIGKLEDDELPNEEDMRTDEPSDHGILNNTTVKEKAALLNVSDPAEDGELTLADKEDDVDMLADVKQMAAAAAAAGQTISSFESQLRPIDRYAMRFLESWDPILNKAALESQVQFEERDWELDRIEKLKEDMEAEIDDDEEPLAYERWDADFATEVYRQQVEALAQHQLMEDLEREAREKELAEYNNSDSMRKKSSVAGKVKSKKKTKKAKFKSLKKGSLASGSKAVKDDSSIEQMSIDDDIFYEEIDDSDIAYSQSTLGKKRKSAPDIDEEKRTRKPKKSKKAPEIPTVADSKVLRKQQDELCDSKHSENSMVDTELKPINRSKMIGKILISSMPMKRGWTIKLEKLKRKVNFWSKDPFPLPDNWLAQEDAILCAAVHKYGSNWSLVSEILYGMTAGGFYRGRFRHPVHCCERYRELIQRHVLSTTETINNDKGCNAGSGKALLKVTEDNIRMLSDVTSEVPDIEPLVQKHFFALISSVWKVSMRQGHNRSLSPLRSGFYIPGSSFPSKVNNFPRISMMEPPEKMDFSNLTPCGKLVAAALSDDHGAQVNSKIHTSNQKVEPSNVAEHLDLILEIPGGNDDKTTPLPSVVNLSVLGADLPQPSSRMSPGEGKYIKSSRDNAENRFRSASRACLEDCLGWASLAFPMGDAKSRNPSNSKVQSLGKHKLSNSDPIRLSKSKSRRTSESGGTRFLTTDTIQPALTMSDDSRATLDIVSSSPAILEVGTDDVFSSFQSDMSGGVAWEADSVDMFPHHYIHGLLSGLDDCSELPPFTDIG